MTNYWGTHNIMSLGGLTTIAQAPGCTSCCCANKKEIRLTAAEHDWHDCTCASTPPENSWTSIWKPEKCMDIEHDWHDCTCASAPPEKLWTSTWKPEKCMDTNVKASTQQCTCVADHNLGEVGVMFD